MKGIRPVALIILDGWGMRAMEHGNAVRQAHTPNFDRWQREVERCVLTASGEAVGLPADQMGNSEVGHLNLGAGRIVYQDLTRINLSLEDSSYNEKVTLRKAIAHAAGNDGNVHIVGLLGPGGVHSHSSHLYGTIKLVNKEGLTPVLHVITDGRDTPPQSGLGYLQALQEVMEENPATIGTVSGRYYAMDRDKRWDRTEKAYRAMVQRQGETAASAAEAIQNSYDQDVTDEFIVPVVVETERDVRVKPGDALFFYNFRADRMRQIVRAFVDLDFEGFERDPIENLFVATMTEYEEGLPVEAVFPDEEMPLPLAEVLSRQGVTQFHAAETEKYAHVTYFFNGGIEKMYEGESRHLEPSPKVATYDMQPEMSAEPLTEAVLQRLQSHDDAFILVNYANPDMVGHTGDLQAAIRACEAVDACAGKLVQAVVDKGGVALVTADHGNAERMIDEESRGPHTYHTTSPVAFLIVGNDYYAPRPQGILADVAPTVLDLLDLPQPEEMTGRSILEHQGL